jgi:integrase
MKIQPEASLDSLAPSMVIQFFKILDQRKRLVGRGVIKTGIRKSTVATYWSKLNSFFEWLKIKGYIQNNPFNELPYPTPVYEDKKFLKKEEIEKILTAILTKSDSILLLKRNLVIFHILLFCGLRREELILLQVRDIDFDRKMLTVRAETSKVKRTRYIPLHSQLIMYLKDYLQERRKYTTSLLLVSATKDKELCIGGLKHLVKKLIVNSGVHFHLHQFRHTFAVNFLMTSNNIAKLKQLLGHTDINMTIQYLRCLPTTEIRGDIENMSIDNLI